MIWFIIAFIVFVVATIRIFCDSWYDLVEKFMYSFLLLLASLAVAFLVSIFVGGIMSCCVDAKYSMVSDTKIVALRDNQNVSGNFYIMSGYVDEDLYYYYATETAYGYKTEKVKANNSYIQYTDGETHIERYSADIISNGMYFWGIPRYEDVHIIYCPNDTITNEFEVDLE